MNMKKTIFIFLLSIFPIMLSAFEKNHMISVGSAFHY